MERATATDGTTKARRPGKGVAGVHCLALLAAGAVMALAAGAAHWDPATLLVIAGFTLISDLTSVDTGSTLVKVSGSFLGIMLATVILGAVPAALLAMIAVTVGWLHRREALHILRN